MCFFSLSWSLNFDRCESSTAYISYRGTGVAGAPTQRDYIPARARHSISTSVTVFANELVKVPGFGIDLLSGVVKFTSSTTLHGYVKVLKILKAKAEAESTCDVSIFWVKRTSESVCKSQSQVLKDSNILIFLFVILLFIYERSRLMCRY